MQIPAYQIHNVLKAYSRQVSQGKFSAKHRGAGSVNTTVDKISISAEGKKQGVIDKVASDIVKKITSREPQSIEKNGQTNAENLALSQSKNEEFKYYQIKGSSKTMETFSLKDAELMKKRMEYLRKDALGQELNNEKGKQNENI